LHAQLFLVAVVEVERLAVVDALPEVDGPRSPSSTRWTSSATTQSRASIHGAPFRTRESTFSEVATMTSFSASHSPDDS